MLGRVQRQSPPYSTSVSSNQCNLFGKQCTKLRTLKMPENHSIEKSIGKGLHKKLSSSHCNSEKLDNLEVK